MKLKDIRKAAGYTQQKLADKIGVSRSAVAMWESGATDCGLEMATRLAALFGVSVDSLLDVDAIKDRPVSPGVIRIPVYGTIPAGVPMDAIEDVLDYEEIPADWGRGGKEYMALKVSGHSMEPRYQDGDILILRRTESCENGQDCAVMVNGDNATFKRVKLTPGGMMLLPINPDYDPITFTAQEVQDLPVRILGVVVELRRKIM